MKIISVETRIEHLPLARPYTIAFRTISAVEIGLVVLRDEAGREGLGTASPEPFVTGETPDRCAQALARENLAFLIGADAQALPALAAALDAHTAGAPAARAALDMALFDLRAKALGVSLGRLLGRAHERLATSITIGIKPTAEALAEADEYVGRGFRILKVKLGHVFDEEMERLAKLRERVGRAIGIRVDPNQGYSIEETRRFFSATASLDIEFVEQPVKTAATDELRALPEALRARVCVDEALLGPADALRLCTPPRPAGIFNIKLMKCGGIRPALAIAAMAEAAGVSLMWGCMDESRVGIAAALNAAFASPATRYLDLDGSLDLARDVAEGGFLLEDGFMRPLDEPGLGCRRIAA